MENEKKVIIIGAAGIGNAQGLKVIKELVKDNANVPMVASTTHSASPFETPSLPFKINERYEMPKYYPAKGSKFHK